MCSSDLLPFSWAGQALGFVPLPVGYFALLLVVLCGYALLTHAVKVWFVRRWGM